MAYTEEHGKRATGRKLHVNVKCLRWWRNQKRQLSGTNRNRKAFRGKPCKFTGLEKELVGYITSTRKNGYVSTEMIGVKAIAIAHHMNISLASFKASRGWLQRFMNRHGLSIRRRTTLCQKLPSE